MLMPRKVAHRKHHRGRMKGAASGGNEVARLLTVVGGRGAGVVATARHRTDDQRQDEPQSECTLHGVHPFTAPAVSPRTRCFWKTISRTKIGSAARIVPANVTLT